VKSIWQADMTYNSLNSFAPEHLPVMQEKVLELLQCRPVEFSSTQLWEWAGMHGPYSREFSRWTLDRLDRDKESLEKARLHLRPYSDSTRLLHENFKNLPLVLNNLGLGHIDGILVDLGVSAFQLLMPERGFSFQSDALLDMRMDRTQYMTATNLVNDLPEERLADIIYRYGEERYSRRIAAAIGAARETARITRCSQLAAIVSRAVGGRGPRPIHPATRTFQALRIAVNQELEGLEEFFVNTLSFLKPSGRLVVISFHSLEDRIVKRAFRMLAGRLRL